MTHQTPSPEPESSANKEASGDRRLSTCSPFGEYAEKIERLAPVSAEDLMLMSEYLPLLQGEDARIAIAMLAGMVSVLGRVSTDYSKAVACGIKRCDGANSLLNACREILTFDTLAEKSSETENVFGARHAWCGGLLASEGVLAAVSEILANVKEHATPLAGASVETGGEA